MYSGYYGTCIAHVFSLLAAGWAFLRVQKCPMPGYGQLFLSCSQIFVLWNSALALARYGRSDGYKIRKLHVVSLSSSVIGSLSFLHLALNLLAKSHNGFIAVLALNAIPYIYNVSKLDYRFGTKRSDFIIAINCILFLWTSFRLENYNAAAFALSFAFGYFYVGDCGFFLDTEVPAIDIYQYIQCFLCFFTVNAFCD